MIALVIGTTPSRKSVSSPVSPSSERPGIGLPYGDSLRVIEQLDESTLDLLGHDVLPAAGFFVHELDLETDDVGEQPLGEAVLAHHPGGELATLG